MKKIFAAAFTLSLLLCAGFVHADDMSKSDAMPMEKSDAHASIFKLITMPGTGQLKLVDMGPMTGKMNAGMMMIMCDNQCQAALHLVGTPTADNSMVSMGLTLYVDAHSKAAMLLGGK